MIPIITDLNQRRHCRIFKKQIAASLHIKILHILVTWTINYYPGPAVPSWVSVERLPCSPLRYKPSADHNGLTLLQIQCLFVCFLYCLFTSISVFTFLKHRAQSLISMEGLNMYLKHPQWNRMNLKMLNCGRNVTLITEIYDQEAAPLRSQMDRSFHNSLGIPLFAFSLTDRILSKKV